MKILGLDVGTKRIGVARADSSVRIAVPQCTIEVDGTEFEQIARLSRVYGATCFVVGLPRNLNGEETEQSLYTREFAKSLKKHIPGAKVCFQDESLTSIEAEKNLKKRKKAPKKGDIDAEAATLILQDFLEHIAADKGLDSKKNFNLFGRTKKPKKSIIVIATIVVLMGILGVLGFCLYNGSLSAMVQDVDCELEGAVEQNPEACKNRSIVIEDGMSAPEISKLLEEKGLIRSAISFRLYARLHGVSGEMKAGRYDLNRTMSAREIISIIVDGTAGVVVFRITTIPGETLAEFKKTLLENGYEEDVVDAALKKKYNHPVLSSKPDDASLEGYIYGETIEFKKGDSVEEIIEKILDELYNVVIANNLEEKFKKHNLSLHEGIVLASIVQKESTPGEYANVASVFYNRLARGQHLGSDATIQYYLNLVDPKREIYTDNSITLAADSCYNTSESYGHAGLPCGAISSPGLSALKAVAEPADTAYYYFLTGDDNKMYYSTTSEGHNSNRASYCQTLCDVRL